jgi:hypothetical protein
MARIILSTLGQASEPLTSRDIALQLLVFERAQDKSDLRLLRLMTKRVGAAAGPAGKRRGPVRSGAGAVHALGDSSLKGVIALKTGTINHPTKNLE